MSRNCCVYCGQQITTSFHNCGVNPRVDKELAEAKAEIELLRAWRLERTKFAQGIIEENERLCAALRDAIPYLENIESGQGESDVYQLVMYIRQLLASLATGQKEEL